MTDAVYPAPTPTSERVQAPLRLYVSVEVMVYAVLIVLALAMRLAELDVIALGDAEAREALAAWHMVRTDAPGNAPLATSPIMLLLNGALFTGFGASAISARLMTALAGTALVFTPLLWRRELGRVPALLASVFLTFSASTLVGARTMSPVIWAMLFAVVGLRLVVSFGRTGQRMSAVGATVALAGVLLLADPAGWVLLIMLAGALLIMLALSADDPPDEHPLPRLRELWQAWPRQDALLAAGLTVILVGTAFFMNAGGLSNLGESLAVGLAGVTERPAGQPFAFPLLALLLYEPVLWIAGALGLWFALRSDAEGESRLVNRFLAGWVAAALLASLLYAGAGPMYALWLAVPLAALAAQATARLLERVTHPYFDAPGWVVPGVGVGALALLFVASANLVRLLRILAPLQAGASLPVEVIRLAVVIVMSLLLLIIMFFLGGSLWGGQATGRGILLGVILFAGLYSASFAWEVAVDRVDDPHELWHVQPVNRHLDLLRETVQEASYRQTGMPNRLTFVVQAPDDGAVAWQLRDFGNAEYVPVIDERSTAAVIVAPPTFQPETLGARYVGQDFPVAYGWDLNSLTLENLLLWLMLREAPGARQPVQSIVVWTRDDVYGLPPAPVTDGAADDAASPDAAPDEALPEAVPGEESAPQTGNE